MPFRLRRKASQDLSRIYASSRRLFGLAQAQAYQAELWRVFALLAEEPRLGPEHPDYSPPVRIHHHKSHVVVYRIGPEDLVEILGVRHVREDWFGAPD